MLESIVQIDTLDAFFGLAGLVAAMGIAWGGFKSRLDHVSKGIDELKPSLFDIRERFVAVETRVEDMRERLSTVEERTEKFWKNTFAEQQSPRKLNELGKKILDESGIKEVIEANEAELHEMVREEGADNPYDAERVIEEITKEIPEQFPETLDELKTNAYYLGESLDAVLYVGSLYLRDRLFPKMGFSVSKDARDADASDLYVDDMDVDRYGSMSHNIDAGDSEPGVGSGATAAYDVPIPRKTLEGIVIQESLDDPLILNALSIIKTRVAEIDNASSGQEPVWTMHTIIVDPSEVDALAMQLRDGLKPGKWYVALRNDERSIVIYRDRIFDYESEDKVAHEEAQDYGKSLGIPESQLDW